MRASEARPARASETRPARTSRTRTARGTVRKLVPREERRTQILDLAAELFSRRGFAGTTTRQIAAAVGTSETVLFRHFLTKEALYAAILEHRVPSADVDRWVEELRRIADRGDDAAVFTAVLKAVLESYRSDPVFHRLMLFAALEDHELARLGQVKYMTPVTRFLREYVARRQADGAFRRVRPEIVVHMLLSAPAQFAQWTSLGVNPLGLSDNELATQAVTLLAGLRS